MKRKKMEATPESKDFWPIPGVDGEPYPPLVQDALDLVEKETLRRKRAECKHEDRKWITGTVQGYYSSRTQYRRACRDCHLVVPCEHPEEATYRRAIKYISAGRYMEFWDCRCGHTTAKYHEPKKPEEPKLRTPVYGFDYERHPDAMVSRKLNRAIERAQPYDQGALRRSINRTAEERDWERIQRRNTARRAAQKGLPQVLSNPEGEPLFMTGSSDSEAHVLRNNLGASIMVVGGGGDGEDRAPDLSWVRTMNGRQQLR